MAKSLIDLMSGKVSPRDKIIAIQQSSLKLDTPKERFDYLMKIEWLEWSTQKWNQNYSGISFEKYRDEHLHWLTGNTSNAAAIWVRTGSLPNQY